MILKKRQLVTATLVLALGAAVFVNWYFTKPHADVAPVQVTVTEAAENLGDARYVISDVSGETADPFAAARLKREKAQDEAMEALQQVLGDSTATQAASAKASEELAALTARMTAEADIETLIEAKTGLNSLVILSAESAEVLIEKTPEESAVMLQISEIAARKSGLPAEQITVIEKTQ